MQVIFASVVAAYLTGVFTSFAHGNWIFSAFEFFFFPLGVLHGIYCWFF